MKTLVAIGLLLFCGLIIFCGWSCGSRNVQTPAGSVGYITKGAVFGKTEFIGMQAGPTSSGRGWMLQGRNVSITPHTYDEEFAGDKQVLSKDHMQIAFAVHVTFRINPEKVKDFLENYATKAASDDDDLVKTTYASFMKERIRTFARLEIEKYNWQELVDHGGEISQKTEVLIKAVTKDTPFDVISVVVGNVQFPPSVAASVAEAQAATQILQRKENEIKQAEADARKRVAEARGVAEAMEIVQLKLTSQYLQHEAIEAQKLQINSPNHTTIYIPVGPMGVPLTGTFDAAGTQIPAKKP